MTLVVNNKYITKGFISFLKKRILMYMANVLNVQKLDSYDEYLKLIYNIDISTRKLILLSMSNLEHIRNDVDTIIFINPNIKYPGTNIKIIDICKIINYGALGIPPYPIFTDIFNYFTNNIKDYVNKFTLGVGL